MTMPKTILITNDDGIQAEGIQVLSQKMFEKFNETMHLYVVAPDHEQSAVGHAITMHRPLRVDTVRFLHNRELKGWAVNGTPSDCVKLAVEALLPQKPDLVVSGINRGSNLGTDVLYSGTVSAAVEGIILGIPSIALSLTEVEKSGFELAADFACYLVPIVLEHGLQAGRILNINVPPGDRSQIKGVKVTRLGDRRYRNTFQKRTDPRGKSYYWLAGEIIETEDDETTDVGAIKKNYITITPIHFDITCYDLFQSLQKTVKKLDAFFQKDNSDSGDGR